MADYPLLCPTEDESRKGKEKEDEGKEKAGKGKGFLERENKKGESLGFETLSFTFFPEKGGNPIPSLALLKNGGVLLSHCDAVPSAPLGLTSLFGMGRGGSPTL